MSTGNDPLRLRARDALVPLLIVLIAVGLVGGPLDGPVRHWSAVAAGALILIRAVTSGVHGTRRTWLLLGAGLLGTSVFLGPPDAATVGPVQVAAVALSFAMLWAGVWILRQQRIRGRGHGFVVDVAGTLIAVGTFVAAQTQVTYRPLEDGAEILYVGASCAAAMLAASPKIIAAIGGTKFCRRDLMLTLAFGSLFLSNLLLTLGLRRGFDLADPALALTEIQLPLLALAATARPGRAGMHKLGTLWEWLPPALWTVIGAMVLLASHSIDLPAAVIAGAAASALLGPLRYSMTVYDIRQAVIRRDRSLTDDLTGLPNRHALFDELALLTMSKGASGERATLLTIGLDGFRELNETLGRHAGDRLLQMVAKRLTDALAGDGELMRVGGDEFATVVRAPVDAVPVAQALQWCLSGPFHVEQVNVVLRASIGTARFPEDALSARELARRADVAMADAKRRRVGHAHYTQERDDNSVDRLEIADDLRRALRRQDGGLRVDYQPQLDARTGACFGAEALVRWDHPQRGAVRPSLLLPIAERSGQLTTLTDWVLDQAVATLATLRHDHEHVRIAVNVSAATLVDIGLPERITETLERHGVAAGRLVVEVTEDAVMSDQRRCLEVLERIASLGIEIAIDDFGTGQSSLAQLRYLPASELKIDRSFIHGMTADRLDAEIVRLIVSMGRQVGMHVVAEGVETEIERRLLADLGCDALQGFGIGHPMSADEFRRFLSARPQTKAA